MLGNEEKNQVKNAEYLSLQKLNVCKALGNNNNNIYIYIFLLSTKCANLFLIYVIR